jgi:predicted DNA-binding ribbon-helix-helix protein
MKSLVIKRSVTIEGQQTSITLEDAFWRGLKNIAAHKRMSVPELVSKIDSDRKHRNLSSAVRLFVLNHYRGQHYHETNGRRAAPRFIKNKKASAIAKR